MRRRIAMLFLLSSFFTICTYSQDSTSYTPHSLLNKTKLGNGIIYGSAIYTATQSYFTYVWFHNDERMPFHFSNDFKGYLQTDKFKHALGSYIEGYICYNYLRSTGVDKKNALLFGATLGLIMQSPKEMFDGHYYPGGFSWPDIAANATGSAIFIGQDLLFNEQVLLYKFSYSRSEYAGKTSKGGNYLSNLSDDFNGQTYWFSFNLNRIILKNKLPGWINIAAGYSVNGVIGQYENPVYYNGELLPVTERTRQYLLSMDIDWTKIHSRSRFLNIVLKGLTFIKLPFPAMEVNSKGHLKGYWIYF